MGEYTKGYELLMSVRGPEAAFWAASFFSVTLEKLTTLGGKSFSREISETTRPSKCMQFSCNIISGILNGRKFHLLDYMTAGITVLTHH